MDLNPSQNIQTKWEGSALFFFRRVPRRNPVGKSLLKANPKSGGVPAGFEWNLPVDQFALLYKSDVV